MIEVRPAWGEETIVTFVPLTVATPVKSSMRSSWPAARLEFARGRAKALITLVVPEFVRLRLSVAPLIVTAFARLKSMPIPVLPLMVCDEVMMGVPVVLKDATQISFAGQEGLRLVIATPVLFKKAS